MTIWIEIALRAVQREEGRATLIAALERIAAFAGHPPTRGLLHVREIPLKAPDWRLTVETQNGARTLRAVLTEQPPVPGFARYRSFARPAGDDLAASLREFAEAEAGLRVPLAKAHRVIGFAAQAVPAAADGREIERIAWRIDIEGVFLRALLETAADGHPELRLAAPAVDGSLDALFSLAGAVIDATPFVMASGAASAPSADPVCATSLDVPPSATRRAAFVAMAASVAGQWFGNEAAARDGLGDEHVHQLRVAQRRLKTLLKLFRDDIDETWHTHIAPGLAWFGGLLADARDWDVFAGTTLPAYAASDDDATRWQALIAAAEARRQDARVRLREALASKRHARLALAFIEWLARFAVQEDAAPTSFVAFGARRIHKDYRRIAGVPDLVRLPAQERHCVRIQAKRLRYALEFFRSILSSRTRKHAGALLGQLQSALGEANDAAVAADRLAALPEATDYQRGFARAWSAATSRTGAQEGERVLRALRRPRLKASL
ncbi:CHAD domain-containing protein [Caballeronia sp. LZ033]|uniref:CYTH and CHAD domain-containing protein n=1 Tax=Caballeronia sp. LZ033 TaxID=3038566 RepID=UPI00285EF11F|nr:CHAD domain-containing protein [Caballeronia sp. LZ033]MDR5818444.1 CHAD domain-containing protein [Caballeronia sp. LZ033]